MSEQIECSGCTGLRRQLAHWRKEIGFDSPEEAITAVNARFGMGLPRGLAKSLWRLECKDNNETKRQLTEAQARLSEFTTPMKCGHPRAALDVVERACAVCQQQACIAALERVVDVARAARKRIIGGALLVLLDNALAALDKPAQVGKEKDDPALSRECESAK